MGWLRYGVVYVSYDIIDSIEAGWLCAWHHSNGHHDAEGKTKMGGHPNLSL
jgi:hypothetical protein